FENGDCGNNYHKSADTKFEVGKSYIYELGGKGNIPSIKWISEADDSSSSPSSPSSSPSPSSPSSSAPKSFGKSPEESNRIARMNALTNAINFFIHQQGIDKGQNFLNPLNVMILAREFEVFICEGLEATPSAIEYNKTNAGIKSSTSSSGILQNFKEEQIKLMEDDMPF
ncbi:hypothetical protein UFOVP386_1, partial [uncultured Caudovirales phage]